MCNALYHSSECRCGFGGEGHLGRSPGGLGTHPRPLGRFSWQDQYLDTCRPTKCPRCGDSVFFVRHNGGSVWFDELGPPWPKHGCFDEYRKKDGMAFSYGGCSRHLIEFLALSSRQRQLGRERAGVSRFDALMIRLSTKSST